MKSLMLSFESVMPLFLLMALGYVLKSLKLADKSAFDAMNKLIFKAFLPTLLFYNIYNTELSQVFDYKLTIFSIVGILATFCISLPLVKLFTKQDSKRGVMLQGFFRSNYAILGLPIITYVCGEASGGRSSMIAAIVIPLFNVLAVITLERFRGGQVNLLVLLKGIITNPLIIGCSLGAIFLAANITLPSFVDVAVSNVASIASPLAMVVLGASFTFSGVKNCLKELVITVSTRLIVVPLVAIAAAVALGFRGEALACIMVVFGSPVAVSSFTMAQQMGGDEELAAQVVVISSVTCLATFFGWIFALSSFGLF